MLRELLFVGYDELNLIRKEVFFHQPMVIKQMNVKEIQLILEKILNKTMNCQVVNYICENLNLKVSANKYSSKVFVMLSC